MGLIFLQQRPLVAGLFPGTACAIAELPTLFSVFPSPQAYEALDLRWFNTEHLRFTVVQM